MTFEELMETFRNPGEAGLPETFADDLHAAYKDDLSVRDAAVAARDLAVKEATDKLTAAHNEQLRLKAVNYDLLMAAPKAGEPEPEPKNQDDEPRGIESLFEKEIR